jgi:hypothetical protein
MECLSIIADVNRQRWEPSSFLEQAAAGIKSGLRPKCPSYSFSKTKQTTKKQCVPWPLSLSQVELKFYKNSFFQLPVRNQGTVLELIVRKKRHRQLWYLEPDNKRFLAASYLFLEVVTKNGKRR